MNALVISVFGVLLFYITISALHQFMLTMSLRFSVDQGKEGVFKRNKFLILATASQEDYLIIESTIQTLEVDYNKEDNQFQFLRQLT